MSRPVTIVVSDLHASAGELDDFDEILESSFIRFVAYISACFEKVELVINGDFLDFVQAPPWQGEELRQDSSDGLPLCYTETQSRLKFEGIAKAHVRVFEALGSYLEANSEHYLTIIPGNHDVDFFWPAIRSAFIAGVTTKKAQGGRIQFCLESHYRPMFTPFLWVEHGHQHDPVNSFFANESPMWSSARPPVLHDGAGRRRLLECTGTRFFNLFINFIDRDYHFVDNVKPFSSFISNFGRSALVPGYGPRKAAIAVISIMKYLSKTLVETPSDLLAAAANRSEDESAAAALLAMFRDFSQVKRNELVSRLRNNGFDLDRSLLLFLGNEERASRLLEFLGNNFCLIDDLLGSVGSVNPQKINFQRQRDRSEGMLALAKSFNVNETELLKKAAVKTLALKGVGCVAMGHTHEFVVGSRELPYYNTGCWTRYVDFAQQGQEMRSWELLRQPYATYPFRQNYLYCDSDIVELKTWELSDDGR